MGRDERVDHDGYRSQPVVIYPYPEPTERSLRWVAAHTLHEVRHYLVDIRRQLGHARWLR
jgi:hypothetical protein